MQITLSKEQTQVIESLVKQGKYPSLEEAINTALLLLIDDISLFDTNDNPEYLVWAEATQEKINLAREQAKRGEVLKVEDVLAQLRNKVQQAREAAV
jgi:antitoxin ParD1/3/4